MTDDQISILTQRQGMLKPVIITPTDGKPFKAIVTGFGPAGSSVIFDLINVDTDENIRLTAESIVEVCPAD